MSKFLVYTHDSGEVVFVKRDSITSFHPRYVGPNNYRIEITVGPEKYTIKKAESLVDANKWISEQIAIIEKANE